MPFFNYTARDAAGKIVKGSVEANDQKQAVSLIRERKLFITNVEQVQNHQQWSLAMLVKRVSFNEIVNFTRQLSAMVEAGLQLPQAVSILRTQTENPTFNRVLNEIMNDIRGGGSLADALSKHPNLFNKSYISLIKAGETSGNLDVVLNRLAENLEKDRDFRSKVRGALVYPVIVLLAMFIVVGILMIFVVPQISQLYADFDFELPITTRMLIAASNFTVAFWWLILILGFGAIYAFREFSATDIGKRMIDTITLKLPLFGDLIKQILLVEFTRSLGLLIGSGIHLLDSLAVLTESMPNILFKEALEDIAKKVEKGLPMGAAFAQYDIFPPILAQMVKVGEETGKFDESLTKLSLYFEGESNQTVKGLTTALEPIIMVVLGIGVGFIVFSIITPIYNLTSQIG